jgi:hypothetical protein
MIFKPTIEIKMKKKNYWIILFSLVLLALSILAIKQQKNRTIENDFVLNDTSRVEKIFMVNKKNEQVELTKMNNIWYVNGEETAIGENVNILLSTLMKIQIRQPISKAAHNTIVKQLATNSVKVEIYEHKYLIDFWGLQWFAKLKKTKVFYVGSPTRDFRGTIMKMENSDDIYITYLPGFNGYLTERFSAYYADWINHNIFKIPIQNILKVRVEFGEDARQSYEIVNNGNKNFDLFALFNNQKQDRYDTIRVLEELAAFRSINYESLLDKLDSTKIDSLNRLIPLRTISLTTIDQKVKKVKLYRRPNFDQKPDFDGTIFSYDLDRMYALVDGMKHPVSTQYFVIDNITRPLSFLLGTKMADTQNMEGMLIGSEVK